MPWIEFFKNRDKELVEKLKVLLDEDQVIISEIVYLEILNGARRSELERLQRVLKALPMGALGADHFSVIEGWLTETHKKANRFGIADLLIAASAHLQKAQLWSLDKDFSYMHKLGWIT